MAYRAGDAAQRPLVAQGALGNVVGPSPFLLQSAWGQAIIITLGGCRAGAAAAGRRLLLLGFLLFYHRQKPHKEEITKPVRRYTVLHFFPKRYLSKPMLKDPEITSEALK